MKAESFAKRIPELSAQTVIPWTVRIAKTRMTRTEGDTVKQCPNCKGNLADYVPVCPYCGVNVAVMPVGPTQPMWTGPQQNSGKATASMVCGILFFFWPAAIAAVHHAGGGQKKNKMPH